MLGAYIAKQIDKSRLKSYRVTSGLCVLVSVAPDISEIFGIDRGPLSSFNSFCTSCVDPFNDSDAFLTSSWKFKHIMYEQGGSRKHTITHIQVQGH